MSKIKELKNKEQNNINLIDLYQKIVGNDKTKYVELLDTLFKNRLDSSYPTGKMKYHIKNLIPDYKGDGLSTIEIFMSNFIVDHIGEDNIKNFTRFVGYNERGLIDNNDVTTYKNFEQICKEVNKADLKDLSKSLSKQVVTLVNDDEWIVVKPLTYESSKKYGSNTKWCTTAANDPQYFYKYFRNGILTYCLNKKTGYKIAVYKALNEKTVTFWNQEDSAIDSFGSELPTEIISLLRKEYSECKKSNFALSDQEFVEKEMELNGVVYRDRTARGNVRVGNQFDGPEGEDGIGRFDGEQPEEEGPEDMFGDGLEDIDDDLEEMVLAPHQGDVERVYGGPGVQIGIDAEAELTAILEREITEGIRRRFGEVEDNPQMEEINVETVVRPLRIHMDRVLEEEVERIRVIDTEENIPEVDLEMELREIGGTSFIRVIDVDETYNEIAGERRGLIEVAPPLHHGNEYRDGMPVGRIVTDDILNQRRNEILQEQINRLVEEVRNER